MNNNETVSIPLSMWKDALIKIDSLSAENERLRSASFVTAVPSDDYEKLASENEVLRKKVDWLMKADRLVIWNGTEWETRLTDNK